MPDYYQKEIILSQQELGYRLDQALAKYCSEISRSRLQSWIKQGKVQVDGQVITKPKGKMLGTEKLIVCAEIEQVTEWRPESIALDISYEDDALLVINKPTGMVVHPAPGNNCGTLVNALLNHDKRLEQLPRAGIIHRLDKDTSGLLVVAKTLAAHNSLVAQLQQRAFEREYQCIVHGQIVAGGDIDEPIGRHPTKRTHMAVVSSGKFARTHYRVREKFKNFTELKVNLETGRTHQIRVHMAFVRHPLVGDQTYGRKDYQPAGANDKLREALTGFRRQALHAHKLGFLHPVTNEPISWQVDAPNDYHELLSVIRDNNLFE